MLYARTNKQKEHMDNEYEKQAKDFLEKTGATLTVEFDSFGSMPWDEGKNKRLIYRFTITKGSRSYSSLFGQSIATSEKLIMPHNTRRFGRSDRACYENPEPFKLREIKEGKGKPTAYDILACIEKYCPDTFEDFCSEYGYETDSRKAEKTYLAVKEAYTQLCTIFTEEEMKLLQEIA